MTPSEAKQTKTARTQMRAEIEQQPDALRATLEALLPRLGEAAALGIDEFILSGYPHLEEAYWFGEGVRPELKRRGVLDDVAAGTRLVSA